MGMLWALWCFHHVSWLFPGGVAAEVRLQPAELLDDPVPEAHEHQTTESAYAGAERLQQANDGHMTRPVLVLTCPSLAGGWRGE